MYFNIKYNIIPGAAFVILLLGIASCGSKSTEPTEAIETHSDEKGSVELTKTQVKAAQIVFGSFEKKNLSEVITANGYTKLPPQNQADVSVFVGGIVRTINVIEGKYVKAGQILATYQSLEYNNIRLQKAALMETYQAAAINKSYLELEYARQKELSDENVNAKKTFQKVAADLELERSKITTLQHQMDILEQNLALGGDANAATIAIKAPISGYITAVNIKIGSNIKPDMVLFNIVDNSKMHVDLLVYEKDLFKVKEGQQVRFVLTNQSNKEVLGTIFSIGKAFQNETKSVAVHADIENKSVGLIPGMYVNALIDVGKNEVNTLPIEAVMKAEGKEFIFIREAGEHVESGKSAAKEAEEESVHFERIEVKTGTMQLGFVQVTPLVDIPADAEIVTQGAYYLQSSLDNDEGGDHGH